MLSAILKGPDDEAYPNIERALSHSSLWEHS